MSLNEYDKHVTIAKSILTKLINIINLDVKTLLTLAKDEEIIEAIVSANDDKKVQIRLAYHNTQSSIKCKFICDDNRGITHVNGGDHFWCNDQNYDGETIHDNNIWTTDKNAKLEDLAPEKIRLEKVMHIIYIGNDPWNDDTRGCG